MRFESPDLSKRKTDPSGHMYTIPAANCGSVFTPPPPTRLTDVRHILGAGLGGGGRRIGWLEGDAGSPGGSCTPPAAIMPCGRLGIMPPGGIMPGMVPGAAPPGGAAFVVRSMAAGYRHQARTSTINMLVHTDRHSATEDNLH